jgi:hypothetical protein
MFNGTVFVAINSFRSKAEVILQPFDRFIGIGIADRWNRSHLIEFVMCPNSSTYSPVSTQHLFPAQFDTNFAGRDRTMIWGVVDVRYAEAFCGATTQTISRLNEFDGKGGQDD